MEKTPPPQIIQVGCAIIVKEGRILIAQRHSHGHLGDHWEFPGGKREPGETIEQCLAREVFEELGVRVKPRRMLREVRHTYPGKDLLLCFWFCDWESGEPSKKDCQDFRWIKPDELTLFRFPPADAGLIRDLIENQRKYF